MSEARDGLVVQDEVCSGCGGDESTSCSLEVASITATRDGWELEGSGALHPEKVPCPYCGGMHDSIRRIIPVECGSYSCPQCGLSDHLQYKVEKVEADGHDFLFEASITCGKCHKAHSLQTVLKNILSLIKIELKPTGVVVETR